MGEERWQPVSVRDAEIEFVERGSGDAIVLVHAGVFSDWFRFVGQSAELDGYRVIRMRRAGYVAPSRPGISLSRIMGSMWRRWLNTSA